MAKNNKIAIITLILLLVFLNGCSNEPKKVYQVGILSGLDFFEATIDGFKEEMESLGYTEGENIIYDIEKSNFDMQAYESIIQRFIENEVDLIFVFPTDASIVAKETSEGAGIPIVFANAFTENTGLVDSIRKPGSDITGVRWNGPAIALERLEIMLELVPDAKRIIIPYQKDYPIVKSQIEALKPVIKEKNLTMIDVPSENADDLKNKLDEINNPEINSTDVILLIAEPLCVTPDSFLVLGEYADQNNVVYGGAFMSVEGHESLFGVTPKNIPQGKQAAFLANKILNGIPAGSIPVVSAENFFLFNYKKAQEMQISVNEHLLIRADEIIE
ncbi:MAG: ABC transporter substrate-binding protein [Candidatus Woesearchaeota archaeon]